MASTRIYSITWKLDSPYGTYLANDHLDIYWNDSSNVFEVVKNSVTVTTGADIPITFTYNQLNETYYKQEVVYQISVCNGTSLLKFQRIEQFPYLNFTTLTDHPSCAIGSPAVCDIAFDSLPVVTKATSATALDGAITVSASSSNGTVAYVMADNFGFAGFVWQTSGTFSGLGAGNYKIFTRDASSCINSITVTVGIDQDYGVLYRLEYYDERLGYHNKTEILQKNYSGSVIEVTGGETPTVLSLRGEGYKDKFVSVISTEMIFNLISVTDAQFIGLYTNDTEQFRMKHSIDSGSGYEAVWTGKVLPNQYEEDYICIPYPVSVLATDGLKLLDGIFFLDDDDNRLTGSLKVLDIIVFILKKIGLGLNIRSGCNLYATGMNSTSADDPLDQSYVDVSRYYLITDAPTCLDVLRYLLEPFGAQIIQYFNVWNVIRVEERCNAFDYREYDSDGNYVSNGTYDPVKYSKVSSLSNRMVWMGGKPHMNISPGYGQLRLIYNLGLKDNLLINGDFAVRKYSTIQAGVGSNTPELIHGTIPDLTGFQLINNGTTVQTGIEGLGDGNVALKFTNTIRGAYLQSEVQTLKLGSDESLKVTIKYKVSTTITLDNFPSDFFYYLKLKVKITFGSYSLNTDGQWNTSSNNFFYLYAKVEQQNQYQTLEINTDSIIDPDYLSGQDFQVFVYLCNAVDYDFTDFADLELTTVGQLGTYQAGYRTEVYVPYVLHYFELQNNTDSNSTTPYLIPDIIRPSNYNATTNPFQWVRQSHVVADSIITNTYLDKISIEVVSNKNKLPETANYNKLMENNNPLPLDKIIYHGSIIKNGTTTYLPGILPPDFLNGTINDGGTIGNYFNKYYLNALLGDVKFTANSADLVYSGYLRDSSGLGYTTWARDNVSELAPLESIYQAMYSAQYNKSWQILSGGMTGDVLFSPIDIINETHDGRKYCPVAMDIDYKKNQYTSIQLLELTDVAISAGDNVDAAFTTAFSLAFKS